MEFPKDLLSILPTASQVKLIALAEERENAFAVVRAASSALEAAWDRRDRTEQAFQNWLLGGDGESRRRVSDEDREQARLPLTRIENEIADRLKPRLDRAQAALSTYDFLTELREWLGDAKRAGIRMKAASAPAPRGDYHKAVEAARRRLDEIDAELARVVSAPRTLSELRQAVIDEIERFAGPPSVSTSAREGSPIRVTDRLSPKRFKSDTSGLVEDPVRALFWFVAPLVKERALSLLPEGDPPGALSDAERERKLDELNAERLGAEREEEAAIAAASAAGIAIARRREADPRAVLEVMEA